MLKWVLENVAFVSWGRFWKGVYLHVLPRYCVRLFWTNGRLGVDWHLKPNQRVRP